MVSMKKYFFLVACSVLILAGCRKDDVVTCNVEVIKVAGLFSETGELSYLGLTSESAIEIAIDRINSDFESQGILYRFEFTAYDTQLDPAMAVIAMNSIAASGCKLVIGPQTSSELLAIKPIADSLGILVVSPSSTAASLAIPDDMVFRFQPGQAIVGAAMAQSYLNQGKQALVMISRNDAGSIGLQTAVANHFVNSGGVVINAGVFNGTDTDFSAVLAEVKNQILNFSSTYSNSEIGVVTTSFDETTLLFNQASSDPVLSSVNWYGGVGFFKNQALLSDPLAAQFAVNTQFYSPGFSLPMSSQSVWEPLLASIFSTTGIQGDALTLSAYDVMGVFGKMIGDNNSFPSNANALKLAFQASANNYNGVTGLITLNENGDRSSGIFDFWGVQNNNGTYEWEFVGQSE
jgi:branched-chain amino acid transport system substrate-binding protein